MICVGLLQIVLQKNVKYLCVKNSNPNQGMI